MYFEKLSERKEAALKKVVVRQKIKVILPNVKEVKQNYFHLIVAVSIICFIIIVAVFCGPVATAWLNNL